MRGVLFGGVSGGIVSTFGYQGMHAHSLFLAGATVGGSAMCYEKHAVKNVFLFEFGLATGYALVYGLTR